MDTTDYPSVPQLNHLHLQLAANSRQVEQVIDSQLDSIEQLFSAVIAEDWSAVETVSRELTQLAPEVVGTDVVREARNVVNEMSQTTERSVQPSHLHCLLAACRSVRKNQNWIS